MFHRSQKQSPSSSSPSARRHPVRTAAR
ncbi:Protein of unknown function [Propionibacterium freudenreichii]|nr:Protein of unknown function [Propionibacterium freudenreichii]